ncbi:MAG: hypothetical protein MZV70_29040 [Desulfobacterales bacterium]|nr:hypothetical protein [Desulfobacterales bacterium]
MNLAQINPHDQAVPGDQGRLPGCHPLLPHGGFLRDVFRGRRDGLRVLEITLTSRNKNDAVAGAHVRGAATAPPPATSRA